MNSDGEEVPLMQNEINMDVPNDFVNVKKERKLSFLNPEFEKETFRIRLEDLKLAFLNENQNEDLALIREKIKNVTASLK